MSCDGRSGLAIRLYVARGEAKSFEDIGEINAVSVEVRSNESLRSKPSPGCWCYRCAGGGGVAYTRSETDQARCLLAGGSVGTCRTSAATLEARTTCVLIA